MLPHTEKADSFTEFFSDVERRLRNAFTAAFGADLGPEVCSYTLAYGWEHWDRLALMDNAAGYLYKVGLRKGRRSRPDVYLDVEPAAQNTETWFEPGLPEALASLSVRQRTVVGLVHGYGWSLGEVAQLLGVGKSTIQSYEARGMKRLRRKMGVTP